MILPPLPPPPTLDLHEATPRTGRGVRLTVNELGFAYSTPADTTRFKHPFRPRLGAGVIQLAKGLVDAYEPFIKVRGQEVPIGGSSTGEQPALKLDFKVANERGESWVCVEVEAGFADEPGADGKPQLRETLGDLSRVEIVHTNQPISFVPAIGRQAIVQVLWKNERPVRVHVIVHFNMRYRRRIPLPGRGKVDHLFL